MFAYLVSTSVSVLLANAMGLLFWSKAALEAILTGIGLQD